MAKWYVEYRIRENGELKVRYMNKIEAKDGKEAIEYVKEHTRGAYRFWVDHDDDEEE